MRLLVLSLIALSALACSTNPVVGTWKAARSYDPVRKELVKVSYDGFLEVESDGTFKVTLPDGSQRTGEYKLDQVVKFTATEKGGRTFRGIYRVHRDTLSVRVADELPDSPFPEDFDPSDDANPGLIEFERKK